MLFTKTRKHKVVDTTTAETVARVKDFVVDPVTRHMVAFVVDKHKDGDTLPWPRVSSCGPDAVTVTDGDAIGEAADAVARLAGKSNTMLKKQAVSSFGDHIGTVTDVAFDGDTGAIESVLIDGEPVASDRLLGIGSYAVVIRAEHARS